MSKSHKIVFAIVAVGFLTAMFALTSSGRDTLKKLYVAVACDGGCE